MARGIFTRVAGRVASSSEVLGAIERAHQGIVSGWLLCQGCAPEPAPLVLRVDGRVTTGRMSATPRPDVPGGIGFLLRFPGLPALAAEPVTVEIRCEAHQDTRVERVVKAEDWNIPALGQIENVTWPVVSGWLAVFDASPREGGATLVIPGLPAVTVQASVPRPDVRAFLGEERVSGFHVDMGDALGYAVPDGSVMRFVLGGKTLHEVVISGSPIGDGSGSCLERLRLDPDGADDELIGSLSQRFGSTSLTAVNRDRMATGNWLETLEAIGFQDHSASTRQWAEYLADKGLPQDVTAAWLALRAVRGSRVPALNPLPDDLARRLERSPSEGLPERVLAWREEVLSSGLLPDKGAPSALAMPVVDRVCVTGLVQHRSGLGQNANHSIGALELAGIHACAEPFFPDPGGWNRRLGPGRDAAAVMAEHAVLLHLPIDRVVQSLAAQPALLASPRVIGYFMWETAVIPRQLHRSLGLVDEIWTATHFVADAYRRVTDTPVKVTGHAVDVSGAETLTRAELAIADDAFVTHCSFDANSTVARKNPNAAIDAFRLAFDTDPDAIFVLKVRNMQQAEHLARTGDPHARGLMRRIEEDPRIRLVTGEWSRGRTLGLIQLADCYISLHRSEGYGYAIAEAMALGTPVVATDYSGSTDFLSAREGWPVPYELIDVLPEEYFYWQPGMQWAEASVSEAAASLTAVRHGIDVTERISAAEARVAAQASLDALRDRYVLSLNGV